MYTAEEKKERNRIAVVKYRTSKKGIVTRKLYIDNEDNKEKQRIADREYYQRNKEVIKDKKLKDYYNNRDRNLKTMTEYREKYIKPLTGKVGTGNYNITLAERHKKEWMKEKLFLYHLKMKDIDGTIFYKYGLTKNLRNRLYQIPYEVTVISSNAMTKYDAVYKEKELLKEINNYIPLEQFGGHTECFSLKNF